MVVDGLRVEDDGVLGMPKQKHSLLTIRGES
jgi:hypothetical protein